MGKKKASLYALVAAASAITAAAFYCRWQNNDIMTTNLIYRNPKIPEAFEGYRIALVSDLHAKMFGKNQKDLVSLIKKQQPDMIALTGDLIDRMHTDLDVVMKFARQAVKIAPVFYVPGNHEADYKRYPELKKLLRGLEVTILENKKETLYRDGAAMELVGVRDPLFSTRRRNPVAQAYYMERNLKQVIDGETSAVRILLSHRPELVDVYKKCGVDLALTGHAHGGQWRIPGVGGLFAPDQGVMPKLTSGMHEFGDTTLVISRGLGNSGFPIRIANRPELVIITLTNVQQA